ncbi:hypothetical protein CR513_26152, partial [Mucuna pruriens]
MVGVLGKYLSDLGMQHWKTIKHVMHYLKITKRYCDSDSATCQDSKCSPSRYVYMLVGRASSWNLRVVNGIERPLKIYCNNNLAVLYSNNNMSSPKLNFINIKFLVERVKNKQIFIKDIGT